jgi:integrase/recombinase XerD
MTDQPHLPLRITDPGYHLGRESPTAGRDLPPVRLSQDEVARLIDGCPTTATGLRQRALIGVFYRTGIVIAEASALKVSDVRDIDGSPTLRVHHDNKYANRTLALDEFAVTLLRPWLTSREGFPGDHLFCVTEGTTKGNKWSSSGITGWIREHGERMGIERVHSGAFRLTLAAELMVEQWPIPYIQAILGTKTFEQFGDVLRHLEISQPPEREVIALMRDYRPQWVPPTAP